MGIQGFTVQLYSRWIDKYGCAYGNYAMYVRKRWLRPENEVLLRSLLNYGKLFFAPNCWPRKTIATLQDGFDFYSDPRVTSDWALEMLYNGPDDGSLSDDKANSCRDLLRAAFKKPNIDATSLDTIIQHRKFQMTTGTCADISRAAFDSGNRAVIAWASEKGFVPTVHQLMRLFSHTNNQVSLRSS
jgi:hypothetical protein